MILLSTLSYIFFFIKACIVYFKHSLKMGYSVLEVEDVVHFFVLIEIVTYASSFLVVMIYLSVASCFNDK